MIKKVVTYTNRAGETVTEDFLFHMNRLELMAVHSEYNGDLLEHVQQIIETRNVKAVRSEMEAIITRAYGVQSEDGKTFFKTPELTAKFAKSPALAELMDEFSHNSQAGVRFVNGALGLS